MLNLTAPLAKGFFANKTFALGPATIKEQPSADLYRAGAAALHDKYGFELKPQVDLMYVQSVLVTAGINDNDDIFLADELWKARHTPVLKPFNWQHTDTDIVGVMYGVAAKDLNGNIIPFDQDDTPEGGYELFTEAAVYKLIHDARAKEIMRRSAQGTLFVSMESWFDNYDYGIVTADNHVEVIRRTESTAWMDRNLRACGGTGKYQSKRVGRILRNITFGGCGFVDIPANKRSDITDVQDFIPQAVSEDMVLSLLKKIERDPAFGRTAPDPVGEQLKERELMSADANASAIDTKAIARESAKEALRVKAEEEAQAKAVAEQEALRIKAVDLEQSTAVLKTQAEELKIASEKKDKQIAELEARLIEKHEALNGIVETLAGATSTTPPEIAKIDSVTDGDSAFQAKISWIADSAKAAVTKAARADELEEDLAAAASAVRESEIRQVFASEVFDVEEVEAYVQAGLSQSDEEYEAWLAQHQLVLSKLQNSGAAEESGKKMPPQLQKKKEEKMDKEKAKSQRDLFRELLQRDADRRAGAKEAYLQPDSLGQNSGVSTSDPGLSSPRHRLVKGGQRPDQVLDGATAQQSLNLSGAEGGSEEDSQQVNPARTLARELYSGVHKDAGDESQDAK